MAVEHEVAIIGAGPYGLSLASYLKGRNGDFQIFGDPMQLWRDHMPKGMHLKSDGFASNLYDPRGHYTLRHYCQEHGVEYQDATRPVELDTFVKYGLAFRKRFLSDLCSHNVLNVTKTPKGFSLRLESDETICARKVVVAAGVRHFRYLPPQLESLSTEYVTHSSDHHDLSPFKNRDVIVLGAGASATDIAALLHENGSKVQLVARQQSVRFHSFGDVKRSWFKRLRHPSSGIGPGLRNRFYCDAPGLFHHLPEALRLGIVRHTLGPAGGWFMRDRVIGQVPITVGFSLENAEVKRDRVYLTLRSPSGDLRELVTEHVIAATGFQPSLGRFPFLSAEICSKLRAVNDTPVLTSSLESSIHGLYFMGPIAANSFGPVMRFAFGAQFSAARISKALGYP
jgi:lysine/ornithine N-monooxygenase